MENLEYLDFDLSIEGSGGHYQARVLASPIGQAAVEFDTPLSPLELENFYLKVGRPRQGVRRLDSPEMESAKIVGGRLFQAVFGDEIYACFRASLNDARQEQKGLRVRLRVNAPELNDLPWEYLYNPRQNQFLSWSVYTPIIRYLESPHPPEVLAIKPPLRILVMISSPSGYPPLEMEREWGQLKKALEPLEKRGLVKLRRVDDASLTALQRYLRQKEVHIFHFIGHGRYDTERRDGQLLFQDENGGGRPMSGQYLGAMLADHNPLRLVVLNACEGARTSNADPYAGVAQSLVQQGIPAVIAMQFPITDLAAITFGREFYSALVDGFPVDAALSEARKAIFAQGSDIEWGTPVYFTRAPDGKIFDVERLAGPPSTGPLPDDEENQLLPEEVRKQMESPPPAQKPPAKKQPSQAAPQAKHPAPVETKPASAAVPAWLSDRRVWIGAGIGGFLIILLVMLGLSGVFNTGPTPTITQVALITSTTAPVIDGTQLPLEDTKTPTPEIEPSPTGATPAGSTPTSSNTPAAQPSSTAGPTTTGATPSPSATPGAAPTLAALIKDAKGIEMALIPAGVFVIGSDANERDEIPVHEVYLPNYYIDIYEVSNLSYLACVRAGSCRSPDETSSNSRQSYFGDPDYANYPVIYVNWSAAQSYCQWRGTKLPTEAEWEKAARGTDRRIYPWGDSLKSIEANFCDKNCTQSWALKSINDGFNDTAPAGSYPNGVSPFGVYDMAGNVWEWVADWYDENYYSKLVYENPLGPEVGTMRILRGGSWLDLISDLRVSKRYRQRPDGSYPTAGFRCAWTP